MIQTVKFNMGDEVMSKKLGVTAMGRVVGAIDGRIWFNLNQENPGNISAFERTYPNWNSKPVYYVEFSSQVKPLSEEQFLEEQESGNPYCEGAYEDLQAGRVWIYPEEDLDLMEW